MIWGGGGVSSIGDGGKGLTRTRDLQYTIYWSIWKVCLLLGMSSNRLKAKWRTRAALGPATSYVTHTNDRGKKNSVINRSLLTPMLAL